MRWLIDGTRVIDDPSDEQVTQALRARDDPPQVWLELDRPEQAQMQGLREALGAHSLALATVTGRHQRPSVASFGRFVMMTLVAASWDKQQALRLTPLHLYMGQDLLVTVHRDQIPALDAVRQQFADPDGGAPEGQVSYLVIDTFVDAGFDVLDSLDRAIDELEDRVLANPSPAVLREMYQLRHQISDLHNVLGAQMDVFQRLLIDLMGIDRSQGMETAFRAIYDHAVRQYEMVDSLRDLISSAMDVYLSTVSNRLDRTMAQLTVVASVFLPLTFLTGFFGMNFSFLVDHLNGPGAFALGVLVMAISVFLMLFLFRRHHWI